MTDGIMSRAEPCGPRQAGSGACARPVRASRIRCPHMLRDWYFSHHACEKVDARGFDPFDVLDVCKAPETKATAFHYGPDRWRYVGGNLVAIVNPATRTVITVLLRGYDEWNDEDARAANGARS